MNQDPFQGAVGERCLANQHGLKLPTIEEFSKMVLDVEAGIKADPTAAHEAIRKMLEDGRLMMEPLPDGSYRARGVILPLNLSNFSARAIGEDGGDRSAENNFREVQFQPVSSDPGGPLDRDGNINMRNDDFKDKVHLGQAWPDHWLQFERDMNALGLDVHECSGPNGWGGPAATFARERLAHIRGSTAVKLDTHELDRANLMAYPAEIDLETGETVQEILASLCAPSVGPA